MLYTTVGDIHSEAHPAFRFIVEINNQPSGAFTECKLPTIEWEFEVVKEGGLNSSVHHLPIRRKPARLTLKNGVGAIALRNWFDDTLKDRSQNLRRSVTIRLLNVDQKGVVMSWNIENACLAKWVGPQMKANDKSVAIQTLELICGEVNVSWGA